MSSFHHHKVLTVNLQALILTELYGNMVLEIMVLNNI